MFLTETYIQRRSLNFNKINQYCTFTGLRNDVGVLITDTHHRILGEPLPKSVKDVEEYRAVAFN